MLDAPIRSRRPNNDARKNIDGTAAQRCVELQQQRQISPAQRSTVRPNEKSRRRQRPAAARNFATLGG